MSTLPLPRFLFGCGLTLTALTSTAAADEPGIIEPGPGPGLVIEVGPDATFQVYRDGHAQLAGPGLVLARADLVTDAGFEAGSVTGLYTSWTPLAQSFAGDGSPNDPSQSITVVGNDDGVKLELTLTHTLGEDEVGVEIRFWQPVGEHHATQLYHLIDGTAAGSGVVFWRGAASSPTTLGMAGKIGSQSILVDRSPWSFFFAGEVGVPAQYAAEGMNLSNELEPAGFADRSLGVQWTLPESEPSVIAYRLRFAAPFCGDAFIGTGEVCDDGNSADGDLCSSTCAPTETIDPVAPGNGDTVDVKDAAAYADPRFSNAPAPDHDDADLADPDDAEYGSAVGGCAAGGGSAGGGLLLGVALAMAGLRRTRQAR